MKSIQIPNVTLYAYSSVYFYLSLGPHTSSPCYNIKPNKCCFYPLPFCHLFPFSLPYATHPLSILLQASTLMATTLPRQPCSKLKAKKLVSILRGSYNLFLIADSPIFSLIYLFYWMDWRSLRGV